MTTKTYTYAVSNLRCWLKTIVQCLIILLVQAAAHMSPHALTWLLESDQVSSGLLTQLRRAVRTSLGVVKHEWVIRNTSIKSSRNMAGLVSCWNSFSSEAAAICVERGRMDIHVSTCILNLCYQTFILWLSEDTPLSEINNVTLVPASGYRAPKFSSGTFCESWHSCRLCSGPIYNYEHVWGNRNKAVASP